MRYKRPLAVDEVEIESYNHNPEEFYEYKKTVL